MVVFAVHLDQMRLEACAYLAEDGTKPLNSIAIENLAAIFRHKDQMDVHLENAMSAMSDLIVFFHRPNYTTSYATLSSLQVRGAA